MQHTVMYTLVLHIVKFFTECELVRMDPPSSLLCRKNNLVVYQLNPRISKIIQLGQLGLEGFILGLEIAWI